MSATLRDRLEAFTGEYPPAWKPRAEGDILIARLDRYSQGTDKFSGKPVHTCLLTDAETGERHSLWLGSAVLLAEFRRLRPKPGETIGLKYLGKREGASFSYHAWRLEVDGRPEPEADLAPLGGETDDVAAAPEAEAPGERARAARPAYNGGPREDVAVDDPFADE